ncbi:hypothetical protein M404DRAFT_1005620 [Pisolithus tinctorius Marx 270]|uniref:Uncharacterized protein n=1 Tax=Pisolithus tinctorius Marx 270 TaxID=870435 RepID=A0A0C3JKJ9_PISTI|nr:hypothetical protein M404DRAFT_1005620 [Pisolithus tinctorius Marx 270]
MARLQLPDSVMGAVTSIFRNMHALQQRKVPETSHLSLMRETDSPPSPYIYRTE